MKSSRSPKLISRACLFAAAALLFVGAPPSARASNIFLDQNGATAGTGATAADSFNGAFWVNAGTGTTIGGLAAAAAYTFTSADVAYFIGGTVQTITLDSATTLNGINDQTGMTFTGSTFTLAGTTPSINVVTGKTTTISSVLAGTAGLTKAGAGTLVLSGTNTYSGTTILSAGALRLSSAAALGTSTLSTTGGSLDAASALTITNAISLAGNLTFTGTANLTQTTGAVTLTASRTVTVDANTLSLGGIIGGAFSLTKAGAGTLVLSGINDYAGITTINAGKLSIDTNRNLGASPTVVSATRITFNGGGLLNTTATMTLASNRGVTLLGNGGFDVNSATTLTYLGIIAGTGVLLKAGAGTLILGGASTFTGGTAISGGTVQIGTAANLGTTLGITFSNGGTVVTTANLTLANAGTLTSGGVFSPNTGTILTASGAYSGAGALTMSGAGTLVLSGTNSYTGGTNITAGTLSINNAAAISAGDVTLAGGTINLQGLSFTKTINYVSGTLTNANGYTGNLDVLGAVSVSAATLGNGVLLVGAGDTVTAATNGLNNAIALSGGTVDFNGKSAATSIAYTSGTLTNAAGYTGDVTLAAVGSTTLTAGSLGSARVIAPTGTTLDFAAGFNNAVRNTGGAVTNGSNYTGTMAYAGGQSINVTADQVAKLAFESGTTAKGSGTLTDLSFAAGSAYTMNIKDGAGVAGVGFDSVTVTGALNLASLSSTNRMTLNVVSLDSSNVVGGNIANQTFALNDPKNFTLFTYGTLTLGNGVTNVADLFTVNYANFKDMYGVTALADWFTVSNNAAAGVIVLTAIPEPSTYGMSLAGLALALAAIRRRNKRKTDAAK